MGRKKNEIMIEAVTPATPLRLDIAARLAFPDGSIGPSALRAEWKRGNLRIKMIANKQYTTLQDIQEMIEKCGQQKGLGSGSNRSDETRTGSSTRALSGSSETARVKSARAALEMNARKLKKSSANTSPQNTKSPVSTNVIQLKS